MRITLSLDNDLTEKAISLTGITDLTLLMHESLKAIIAREAGRRLVQSGDSLPDMQVPPRRRPESENDTDIDTDTAHDAATEPESRPDSNPSENRR